jgi:hypothetical protein
MSWPIVVRYVSPAILGAFLGYVFGIAGAVAASVILFGTVLALSSMVLTENKKTKDKDIHNLFMFIIPVEAGICFSWVFAVISMFVK